MLYNDVIENDGRIGKHENGAAKFLACAIFLAAVIILAFLA
jgi:hypothetical protein